MVFLVVGEAIFRAPGRVPVMAPPSEDFFLFYNLFGVLKMGIQGLQGLFFWLHPSSKALIIKL